MDEELQEVCRELIYHGRHFHPRRDAIVVTKCVNYIKEVASMAGERTSYRSMATAAEEEEPVTDEEYEVENQAPPRRTAAAPRTPARPTTQRTGARPPQKQQQGDGEFITITGLFPTKSGKADTAYIKDDMYEHFKNIRPGDTIGVSMNKKTNRLQLWYIQKG